MAQEQLPDVEPALMGGSGVAALQPTLRTHELDMGPLKAQGATPATALHQYLSWGVRGQGLQAPGPG